MPETFTESDLRFVWRTACSTLLSQGNLRYALEAGWNSIRRHPSRKWSTGQPVLEVIDVKATQ